MRNSTHTRTHTHTRARTRARKNPQRRVEIDGSSWREEDEEEEWERKTEKSLEFESWKEKDILRQRRTGAQNTNNFLPRCSSARGEGERERERWTLEEERSPRGHRAAGYTTHTRARTHTHVVFSCFMATFEYAVIQIVMFSPLTLTLPITHFLCSYIFKMHHLV